MKEPTPKRMKTAHEKEVSRAYGKGYKAGVRDASKNPSPQTHMLPSKGDVRHALETLQRANGADLDEWTKGVLPSDEIREALAAIKSSRENEDAR